MIYQNKTVYKLLKQNIIKMFNFYSLFPHYKFFDFLFHFLANITTDHIRYRLTIMLIRLLYTYIIFK